MEGRHPQDGRLRGSSSDSLVLYADHTTSSANTSWGQSTQNDAVIVHIALLSFYIPRCWAPLALKPSCTRWLSLSFVILSFVVIFTPIDREMQKSRYTKLHVSDME